MKATLVLLMALSLNIALGQMVPSESEQITHLVTFGPECSKSWGDDDYSQVFFFVVPESFTKPIYIRVFDPDIGGEHDEPNGAWNTSMKFAVYGGNGAHSHPDAKSIDPVGNYKSGLLLDSKVFLSGSYDNEWYTFGPFNPLEGESSEELKGRVFKIVADGISGDDGNLYKYFLSTQPTANKSVEGANAFTYEYSFRLPEKANSVAHLYPFIDKSVVSITQHNFDFDNEGSILIYSVAKNHHKGKSSGDSDWQSSKHEIVDEEKNTTVDIQITKKSNSRNDMVCYITNQYDEAMAFFSVPVGGPPRFKYKVNVRYKNDGK